MVLKILLSFSALCALWGASSNCHWVQIAQSEYGYFENVLKAASVCLHHANISLEVHVTAKVWTSFPFSFFFSALIKSDLRRHNVNSGIMNLDVKAVSGDSFSMIVLPTWMLDFYWHNNISCKREIDKILWLFPCCFWTTEPYGMLPSDMFFSLTPIKKWKKTSALTFLFEFLNFLNIWILSG